MPPVAAGLGEPEENQRKYVLRVNGCVASFIDAATKVGAMVELNCESEFVARADELRRLAEQIAKHIAEASPKFISKEDSGSELSDKQREVGDSEACLLEQRISGGPGCTIREMMDRMSIEMEDDIRVRRYVRFGPNGSDSAHSRQRKS